MTVPRTSSLGIQTNQLNLHGTLGEVLWKEKDVGILMGFVFKKANILCGKKTLSTNTFYVKLLFLLINNKKYNFLAMWVLRSSSMKLHNLFWIMKVSCEFREK